MLALNMIVGPYEEPFIEASIFSCIDICDQLVFVDTAPGNNPSREFLEKTKLICENVKIIDMPRKEDKDFDFAEARELARVNTDVNWILRLDADEVLHEKDLLKLKAYTEAEEFYSAIEVAFYHHMIYPWLYQYIEPKTIMFRRDFCNWYRGVHELLKIKGNTHRDHDIKYHHYGYCRGQEEVFKRWQLYVEIDGKPTWYHGQNPAHILDDRLAVCQNFNGEHPQAVKRTLDKMFEDVAPFRLKEIPRYNMTDAYVGLLLLTYNDYELTQSCLNTLVSTLDYPVVLHCLDQHSTDGTFEYLKENLPKYQERNSYLKVVTLEQTDSLIDLSLAMNKSFEYLMGRQECEYIGWIHPDMFFHTPWLRDLVDHINDNPWIGKLCAYNPRDAANPPYGTFYPGQEQCYITRRGVLLKVGLFDERFVGIGGYEDWDLNRRIANEGWQVCIDPFVPVLHVGMQTRAKRNTSQEQGHNAGVYRSKWGDTKEVVSC